MKLALCAGNVRVTNAPADQISVRDRWEHRRFRWQIEWGFRGFQSAGRLERTPARALTELFARLLG
jgi:hypothetical protein